MRSVTRLRALAAALLIATAGLTGPAAADVLDPPVGGPLLGNRGLVLDLPPGVPAPPRVRAKAYVVADAGTGEVLAAKNPHRRLPPASTIKTLTALTVHPALDPAAVYTATSDDANVEGSRAGIVAKGTYTVSQLFQALFLRSGNDAANALANANGGVPETVAQMNAKAAELGALDTYAVNPSGLDEPGQLTSAYDLALLGRAAVGVPELVAYATTISAKFPGKPVRPGRTRKTFELWTQQKFVLNYDGALGVKNGFTTNARNTLVAAAERDGRTLVVTLLNTGGQAWQEAAALSDWGFRHGKQATPVGTLVEPGFDTAEPVPPASGDTAEGAAAALPAGAAAAAASSRGGVSATSLGVFTLLCLAGSVVALRVRVLVRRARRAAPHPHVPTV